MGQVLKLGDPRLIALASLSPGSAWSPVVLGCDETGAAGLVETPFSSFALPVSPEEAPHATPPRPK